MGDGSGRVDEGYLAFVELVDVVFDDGVVGAAQYQRTDGG